MGVELSGNPVIILFRSQPVPIFVNCTVNPYLLDVPVWIRVVVVTFVVFVDYVVLVEVVFG